MERIKLIQINPSQAKYPLIRLTAKGIYYGKEYLTDYNSTFDKVVSFIGSFDKTPINSKDISEELKINFFLVWAIFIDLENNNLVKTRKAIGGVYIYKITERGHDFFNSKTNYI